MRKILIVGAGKSSPYLIKYLLDKSQEEELLIHITDLDINHLKKYKKFENCSVSPINILSEKEREKQTTNRLNSLISYIWNVILVNNVSE